MASERLNVTVIAEAEIGYYDKGCGHRSCSCEREEYVKNVQLKTFGVYYPTDADWKESAQLVHNQIAEKVGKGFSVLGGGFLERLFIEAVSIKRPSKSKEDLAKKFIKLLLWEQGKTPVEEKWLQQNRPTEPLNVAVKYGYKHIGL